MWACSSSRNTESFHALTGRKNKATSAQKVCCYSGQTMAPNRLQQLLHLLLLRISFAPVTLAGVCMRVCALLGVVLSAFTSRGRPQCTAVSYAEFTSRSPCVHRSEFRYKYYVLESSSNPTRWWIQPMSGYTSPLLGPEVSSITFSVPEMQC